MMKVLGRKQSIHCEALNSLSTPRQPVVPACIAEVAPPRGCTTHSIRSVMGRNMPSLRDVT
jgi:hypothetical protein